jgi:hypothetical protein
MMYRIAAVRSGKNMTTLHVLVFSVTLNTVREKLTNISRLEYYGILKKSEQSWILG